jgi:hypothetical protein
MARKGYYAERQLCSQYFLLVLAHHVFRHIWTDVSDLAFRAEKLLECIFYTSSQLLEPTI